MSATFEETATKPKSFLAVLARMGGLLWRPELARWRPRMAAALVLTLAAKGLSVVAPIWLGDAINRLVAADHAGAGRGFMMFIVIFGLARFLSNALPQLRDAYFFRVTQDANRLVAVEAFGHAQDQSLQFHLTRRAGALNRIIERGAGAMEYLLRFLAFNIGPTIVELILAAAVMTTLYSWTLGAAAIATCAVYAWFTIVVTERRNALRRKMNTADTELRAIATDTLANFETVKAFGAERREARRYDAAMRDYNDAYVDVMQSLSFLNAGQEFFMAAGLVAAALLSGGLILSGHMKAGDVTAVILMLTNIYRPLNILGFAWREIRQGAVDIEKLFDLMDLKPGIEDAPGAPDIRVVRGEIVFDHVSFTHDGRAGGLDDVAFKVPGGAFVGIVGPSGAGKSTILKLLFRFYDPASGRVLIDGADVRSVAQNSLRRALGLVPQDVALFNDTLRFNLAYARPEATDTEILAAANRAQLGEFIAGLPQGLETRVGERGLKLSGGERQRVGLARAILLDPPILILDEATSSLDSATEKDVQKALAEAAVGRTTIAVAHRLSTIAAADMILVLDEGRVVEHGRHEALIAHGGLYADLWRRQTEAAAAPEEAPALA